jgi:kynureninase
MDIFDSVGMEKLRAKSEKLTGYLEFLLTPAHGRGFVQITPREVHARGAQLSLLVRRRGRAIHEALTRAGIVCDWREPDVIRVAPVPLYNRFMDVYRFAETFKRALAEN